MTTSRYRVFVWAGLALVCLWGAVLAGYQIAAAWRPTPEKVRAYASSLELDGLSPAARRAALERLARQLNALGYEERRAVRLGQAWERLFEQMTDAEKLWFVEQTLPGGVKQMLDAFEALPEEKRRRAVEDSVRRLREAGTEIRSGTTPLPTNRVVLSEEMQRQIVQLGMKAFYSESSAQTKAELAPVLEEMQRLMESGRLMQERER
ncbi:MAG: hypothetical protein MUE94_05620 [Verrucomicrobia bacterium]|jgi:hypothetical protein|nr:hypothetical protein [Verrucomicrobiota bacterium]